MSGVAALLYLNSLPGEFVFDDHEAIENNADVRYIASYSYIACLSACGAATAIELWVMFSLMYSGELY